MSSEELEDCPICLETLTVSEQIVYPLPCQHCDFNYCSKCVLGFCTAAEDDFQVASDGSRQVKVSVACPQCRFKYPMDIQDVLLLRQAHTLGCGMIRNGEMLADSDLTASQLSWKRDFMARSTRDKVNDAYALYAHLMTKERLEEDLVKKEAEVWKLLLEKLPMEADEDGEDGEPGSNAGLSPSSSKSKSRSPNGKARKPVIDETLFHGLEEFMNRDEKIFLTELFTSGQVRCLAQAAMILHGVLRMSMSGKHAAISKQNEPPMSKYESQKHVDFIAKTKLSFPLSNHMPGYFLIPSYSSKSGWMTLSDQKWDGSITPPPASKRSFNHIYGQYYKPPQEVYPQKVVTVQGVRGPIGRLGLRRGDVITHVNDAAWTGTAQDLQEYIYECNAQHPQDEISLTVNCNVEIATFLKIRHEMMRRSQEPPASNRA